MIADPALVPPLKWAGGKRWLTPRLTTLWERNGCRRLVEPFVGGLAVALALKPPAALLNDFNPHLIAFYRHLRQGLDVERLGIEFANDRAVYDGNRKRFNALIAQGEQDGAQAAALFYYLNRTGFNGLCRFNARGFFNVPFGRYARIAYRRDFTPYAAALADYTFSCGDFELLARVPGDFVYADPPYDVEFTSYFAGSFGWNDQVRLATWLAAHAGPVVASNQATPRVLALYEELGFDIAVLDAPRRISCTGDRTPAREMLATRNCV